MPTDLQLKDMAIAKVKGVGPDDTIRKAHALMDEFNVDQVPILDNDGNLLGVVTRRQLIHIREDWGEMQVGDRIWTPRNHESLVRTPNTPLDDTIDYLFNNDFVLISSDGKEVAGIVTINDVAKHLYQQQASTCLDRFLKLLSIFGRKTSSKS